MLDKLPDFLTVPEVAKLLRVGRNKAYRLIRDGTLTAIWLGRSPRVPRDAIIRLVNGLEGNWLRREK
ncbi:MAG: helix-turn-helix domain-containing protein [Bacillota bacterium]|jgi:excisionase family DNA binding protein